MNVQQQTVGSTSDIKYQTGDWLGHLTDCSVITIMGNKNIVYMS